MRAIKYGESFLIKQFTQYPNWEIRLAYRDGVDYGLDLVDKKHNKVYQLLASFGGYPKKLFGYPKNTPKFVKGWVDKIGSRYLLEPIRYQYTTLPKFNWEEIPTGTEQIFVLAISEGKVLVTTSNESNNLITPKWCKLNSSDCFTCKGKKYCLDNMYKY